MICWKFVFFLIQDCVACVHSKNKSFTQVDYECIGQENNQHEYLETLGNTIKVEGGKQIDIILSAHTYRHTLKHAKTSWFLSLFLSIKCVSFPKFRLEWRNIVLNQRQLLSNLVSSPDVLCTFQLHLL